MLLVRTALFPGACGAMETGTHPAAARPDGKGERESVIINCIGVIKRSVHSMQ